MVENTGVHVKIKPPVLYSGFLFFGFVLNFISPASFGLGSFGFLFGASFVFLGFFIAYKALQELKKYRTSVHFSTTVRTIVTTGVYRYSRNPIYSGLSLFFIGINLIFNNIWGVSLFLPLFMIMNIYIIDREELYLSSIFGEDYHDYCKIVRRWV